MGSLDYRRPSRRLFVSHLLGISQAGYFERLLHHSLNDLPLFASARITAKTAIMGIAMTVPPMTIRNMCTPSWAMCFVALVHPTRSREKGYLLHSLLAGSPVDVRTRRRAIFAFGSQALSFPLPHVARP